MKFLSANRYRMFKKLVLPLGVACGVGGLNVSKYPLANPRLLDSFHM